MSTQVVDLVRDSTMQKMQAELVAVHKASAHAGKANQNRFFK